MIPNASSLVAEPRRSALGRAAGAVVAASLLSGAPVAAQGGQAAENELKAAFLLNFAKYVEWPAGTPKASFTVAALGSDPLGGALKKIEGKAVRGATVAVKTLREVSEAADCDLVFVPAGEAAKLPELLRSLRGKNVLVVGDSAGFAADGGGVNFYVEDKKLRFEINVDAAADAGLKVSSQLLKLARVVKPARPKTESRPAESRPSAAGAVACAGGGRRRR